MKIFFIFDGNKHEGPFSIDELQAKGIKRDTFVWKEGLPDWVHAEKVEELEYILPAPVVVEAPPAPVLPPDPVVEIKATTIDQNKTTDTTEKKIPVEEKKTEVKPVESVQQQKPAEAKQPAKEKFAVIEEKKAEVKTKIAEPKKQAPVVAGTAAKNKKKTALIAAGIVIVLVGGALGYYFYTENQNGKVPPQTNQSLLEKDTAVSGASSNDETQPTADENTGTSTTEATDNNTVPTDDNVAKTEVKDNKTNPATDKSKETAKTTDKKDTKTADTKKTETKAEEKKTESTKRDPVVEKTVNPADNLSISGSYKKNLFGEGVLEGKVYNGNENAEFKKVVIEATYYKEDGSVIKSEQFTKSGSFNSKSNTSFKVRVSPPKNVKNVSYKIVSAQ